MKQWNYTDFDDFASAVRHVDCKMMVHCPQVHQWNLSLAHAGKVEVQHGNLGTGNILEGKAWRSAYLFYLPVTQTIRYAVNSETIKRNAFWVVEPDGEFSLSSNGAHDWFTVLIPSHLFWRCRPLTQRMLRVRTTNSGSHVIQVDPELVRCFSSTVQSVLSASKMTSAFAHSRAGIQAEQDLVRICRRIFASTPPNNTTLGRAKLDRCKLVERGKNYIDEVGASSSCISDMAKYTGVSTRSLRNVFYDLYSVGPKRYVRALQARNIRDDLLASDPSTKTVSQVLLDNGVYDFGRYAGIYKKLYGELLSDTLRRTR